MGTRIAAPFPDVDLEEKSIIEVDTGNNGALITRVVVHFTQDIPDLEAAVQPFVPIFKYSAAQ
jgi:hypothetical protein